MGTTSDLFGNVSTSIKSLLFATGNLNHAVDSFAMVAQKLEKKSRELDEKERKLQEMARELQGMQEELNKKNLEYQLLAVTLEQREQQIEEKEKKCGVVTKQPNNDLVRINVGGMIFTIAKASLCSPGSYFEAYFSAHHTNAELFIDRDPKHFRTILNYLRDESLPTEGLAFWELEELITEFEFYKINIPKIIHSRLSRCPSSRFDKACDIPGEFQFPIGSWIPNKRFRLVYKATRDGFGVEHFHIKCDTHQATLVVVQAQDYLFGGYSPEPWEDSTKWKTHPESFIFTLTNPHSIPPTKYALKPHNQYAVLCCSYPNRWCFGFGGGSDVLICSDSHQLKHSHFNFPHSYIDTTGKGKETFTGSSTFTTQDIHVYSVDHID